MTSQHRGSGVERASLHSRETYDSDDYIPSISKAQSSKSSSRNELENPHHWQRGTDLESTRDYDQNDGLTIPHSEAEQKIPSQFSHALPFYEGSYHSETSGRSRKAKKNLRPNNNQPSSYRTRTGSTSTGESGPSEKSGDGDAKSKNTSPPLLPARPPRPKDKKSKEKKDKESKKRIFGIVRDRPFTGPLPDDYEHRYPEDEFGEEMGPTARVWRVYLDEAEFNDRDMVEGWKDGIDVLLVFAGLFSAVVTTFVAQTSQKLDVDYSEVSASLLIELIDIQRAMSAGSSVDQIQRSSLNLDSDARFDAIDKWVNALWFTSLSFSLVTALGAVVIKQWIQHYVSLPSGTPNERVRLHQFRYMGIQRWSVPAIIGVLPFLLHIALFLFFGGLVAFLSALQGQIAWAVGVVAGMAGLLYVITSVLPFFDPQCPYRTPLIMHAHTLISVTASLVHRFFAVFFHRIVPQISLQVLRGQDEKNRLVAWCRQSLDVKLPQYALTSLKDLEIQAAAKIGLQTDLDAIRWLFSFSSNTSVRTIALQAFSGIKHQEQSNSLIDTYMEQEVKDAVRSRLLQAVSRYYKEPEPLLDEFVQSSLFLELERLLRASMLVFDSPLFSSTHCIKVVTALLRKKAKEIDNNRLLTYTAYAFANCDDYGLDTSLSDSELVKLAENLFEMSEINQHPAGKHPLIWKGFFAILDRFTPIFYGNTSIKGFLTANNNLYTLLDTMLLSQLSYPGQATESHKEVVESIVEFLYRAIGNGLPRKMSIMFPIPIYDRGKYDLRSKNGCSPHLQFWVVMMKAIISSCTESAYTCRFALLNHMARFSDYCHRYPPPFVAIPEADFMSILGVLDDLYHQPFFHETEWDYPTYEEFFFLYLKLEVHYDTHDLLINPLLQLMSAHIANRNLVKGLFGCLAQIMKDYSVNRSGSTKRDKGTGAITKLVKGAVDCMQKLHEEKNYDALATIFSVLSELNWLEELLKNIGAMIDRYPPIWYWRTVQPLIHALLKIMFAYLDTAFELPSQMRKDVDEFYAKMREETTLEILCEMFICLTIPDPYPLGDTDTPTSEADIILQLAKRDGEDNKPWRRYINNLVSTFNRLHSANQFDRAKRPWKEWDYEQYERVAKFVDDLKESLNLQLNDYEIPRFDDSFITRQLELERARTFDVQVLGSESSAEKAMVKRPWTMGGLGRLLHKTKKRPPSHATSPKEEKDGDGSLV